MTRALLWPVIGRVGWGMEVIETFADYYDAVAFVNANPAYEIGEPSYADEQLVEVEHLGPGRIAA